MKKIFIIALILAALAAGGYYYVQRILRDPAQLVDKLPEIAKHLEFELDNVRYGHTRLGVKKWELSTHKAKRIKGQKNILLEGVTARIFADGKLKDDTRIQAERGSYLVDRGDMELQGTVKIKNKQFNIETEHLLYRADSEQIEAPDKVSVDSEKLSIKANRAIIDLKQQQLHFSGAVKATIRLDKKPAAENKPAEAPGTGKIEKKPEPKLQETALAETQLQAAAPAAVNIEKPVKKSRKLIKHKIGHKFKPEVKVEKHQ